MQHFLCTADLSAAEIWKILHRAKQLKDELKVGRNQPLLHGKILGMVFQKPSLRTRVSFEVGMLHLGGQAIYLSPDEVKLGQRESAPDVARVLSGYVDAIVARVFEHDHLLQLAQYSRVPVINGLSDYNHPCQAIADFLTIWEHFGRIENLKLAYIGDGSNVAVSLALTIAQLGGHFAVAAPPAYELPAEVLAQARHLAETTGATITTTHDPAEAAAGAAVIYTDTWVSMGQEEERATRLKVFPPYQVNQKLLAKAAPEVVVMHCLPAHRGEEITDEVADGPHSLIFQQAANRLHAQKAILVALLSEHL
jgi:ornithine carbamoyltransferase